MLIVRARVNTGPTAMLTFLGTTLMEEPALLYPTTVH